MYMYLKNETKYEHLYRINSLKLCIHKRKLCRAIAYCYCTLPGAHKESSMVITTPYYVCCC